MTKKEMADALMEMVAELRGWNDPNKHRTQTKDAIADAFEELANVLVRP